ncbi:MAG: hypothetical protein ACKVP3_04835 [Hyphomicrobiaceae bacterium]
MAAIVRPQAGGVARTFAVESIQTRAQEHELDPCLVVGSHFRPTGNRPALPQERTPYSAEDRTPPPRQILPIVRIGKPCLHARAHDLFPVTQVFVSRDAPFEDASPLRSYVWDVTGLRGRRRPAQQPPVLLLMIVSLFLCAAEEAPVPSARRKMPVDRPFAKFID